MLSKRGKQQELEVNIFESNMSLITYLFAGNKIFVRPIINYKGDKTNCVITWAL